MSVVEALLLAIVQGLTEFLPVSSSGHLGLGEAVLGLQETGVFYAVLLHVATMLAVMLYFRRELLALLACVRRGERGRAARRVVGLLVVASVPTAILGFGLQGIAEHAYQEPPLIGAGLLVTSALLVSTLLLHRRRGQDAAEPEEDAPAEAPRATDWIGDLTELRWRDAIVVGLAQGVAVWPGISRSGSTIAAALWMGVRPVAAARFSLLASLPAIGGGFLLELRKLEGVPADVGAQLLGFACAFVVGLLAIGWLLAAVRGRRLAWFAAYTTLLALVALGTGVG